MTTEYSVEDLLEFLNHASDRGLIPAATAQALGVACRNVFGILSGDEKQDVRVVDVDTVFKRFANKRAKEFNPSSLKEYRRRVSRALDLFKNWRESPADFSVKTRTNTQRKAKQNVTKMVVPGLLSDDDATVTTPFAAGDDAYQSSFPIRPGRVITLLNVPTDLSVAEADRLAQFVKMLALK